MENSRVIRKFERFLFKGIPEQPETIWERDYNTYVFMRQTGRAQANAADKEVIGNSKIIGSFTYDFEKQKEIYVSQL